MISKDNKLKLAVDLCHGEKSDDSSNFFKIYPFTTENLSGWMPLFIFFEKSFLTVGSSCDQLINASLLGSKKQTIVDINPFFREYFFLKKAGLLTLNRKEFLDFFCSYFYKRKINTNVFNRQTLKKILPTIENEDFKSYIFWQELFDQFQGNTIKRKLFLSDEERCCPIIQKMNLYLIDDDSYCKTQNAIKTLDVDFIEADIYQYSECCNYDIINLSNIGQYAKDKESLIKFKELIIKLARHMNVNGNMLVMYFFGTTRNNLSPQNDPSFASPIYDLPNTIKLFEEFNSGFYTFPSVKEFVFGYTDSPDKVMIYKKN